MENKTKQILEDLYMIDKKFKDQEDDLIKIINKLIETKPEIKVDEKFINELRRQLLTRARLVYPETSVFWASITNLNKLSYIAGGLAVLILIILPLTFNLISPASISFEYEVTSVEDGAFGVLTSSEENSSEFTYSVGSGSVLADNLTQEAVSEISRAVSSASGVGATSALMPTPLYEPEYRPTYINYDFVYEGEEFSLEESKLPVYKRKIEFSVSGTLARELSKIVNILDFSKLQNVVITELTAVENKDFGYIVRMNLEDNTFNIQKNWQRWPNDYIKPLAPCYGDVCIMEQAQVDPKDLPSESETITIANQFINKYSIDLSAYDEPELSENPEMELLRYIPQYVSVVYPLKIENKLVYDSIGNKTGLTMMIDVKEKKISSLSNGISALFESSNYETEQDTKTIIEIAKKGGQTYFYQHPNPTKTYVIKLGTPELILTEYWKYDSNNQTSEKLFIPAYKFPVTGMPEEIDYYSNSNRNIIVPVIKDLLINKNEDDPPNPYIGFERIDSESYDIGLPAIAE
ncbi:hypothetical protein COU49_01110 [Candidatus Nomurabacteria bacterium CG10_big_fil_rev_8_21_14_0_10_35_16]|uniref:Uncharacterized protein n=1 Tax=Candidatus Nomurabacteria bacterium CG10_big_fil_rev_8_21_14_0_10_35_16 TaxID=1974731 RepID=A0A2H0TBQ4_9BACT|nr:MAG: hypothetical protein COU49_01110 [Candidatus Nomurabacteria bacterium CG10_big_fil_rev_8_21_14_0_10_35_16]